MQPVVLGPEEGERLNIHGANTMTFKALADDTNGRYTLCHYEAAARWPGPQRHTHDDFEESFYVLDGEFEFRSGRPKDQGRPGHVSTSSQRRRAHVL